MTETQDQQSSKLTKRYKDASPEEIRHRSQMAVEKAVASVAGAVKGFAHEMEESQFADTLGRAIHQAMDAAKQVTTKAQSETQDLKQSMKEGSRQERESISPPPTGGVTPAYSPGGNL